MTLPSSIPQGLEDGRIQDLLHLQPEDMRIEDIASRLAKINRYAGATRFPYSVATHSVLVSHLARDWSMSGLLHDIPEAFAIGDMITPIKRLMPDFRALEERITGQLMRAFPHLTNHRSPSVEHADRRAFHLESLYMRGRWPQQPCQISYEPEAPTEAERKLAAQYLLCEIPWQRSRDLFLERYKELTT